MLRWLSGVCLGLSTAAGLAQQPDPAQAAALYNAGKRLDALPLYEELAKEHPAEMLYQDHLAGCLNARGDQADDPAEKKRLSLRAQEAAKLAVALGDTNYAIQMMAKVDLNALAPDPPMTPARLLLHEAEKSLVAGDYKAALAKYAQAADADPSLYEAPLFAGDAASHLKDYAAVGRWYARAITINPDREIAYRYWGDAILAVMAVGNQAVAHDRWRADLLAPLAKAKYLDAIVAEPYKPVSQEGIKKWAKLRNATIESPVIDRPQPPTPDPSHPGKILVNMNPKRYIGLRQSVAECWMMYSLVRADYLEEGFKKEFPQEKQYRHTLKEESSALNAVVKAAKERNIKPEDMDESLRNLMRLSDAGMLNCWILTRAADPGIALDYDAYRKEHRQLLHDYLDRFVVHSAAAVQTR